jgi:signal transduction histidine kinase
MKSMEKNVELSQEKQLSIAHQTNELVSRLSRLIDDMLDVSRIRTGKLRLDKSPCNLSDVIREVTFRMSYLFEAAGMKLPSIIEHQKVTGNWDRFRIEQVIGNLLTNAIRYGLNKPVKIEIFEKDHNAVFSVADQGFGIAEDDLSRIFDRYERVNNTNAISGMGLGLFITKEIVEAHQGKIWVESTVGQGSTFYVSLPL